MTLEVDFVPFATAGGANVTSQAAWIAEATTGTGFVSGVASSADCNKAWRQGTSMAAAVANFVANELNANVLDNGSITTLTTQLTDAVTANATSAATTVVDAALASLTLPFTSITGTASDAQIPQGAVTQYQSQLQIIGSQISGSLNVTSCNLTSDADLKKDIKPLGDDVTSRFDLLHGYTFKWKDGNGEEFAGILAQDLAKALPQGVRKVKGHLVVDPMACIALLIETLRRERHERRALEARVLALEAR